MDNDTTPMNQTDVDVFTRSSFTVFVSFVVFSIVMAGIFFCKTSPTRKQRADRASVAARDELQTFDDQLDAIQGRGVNFR